MDSKRISLIAGVLMVAGAFYFFVSTSNFNFMLTLFLIIVGFTSIFYGFRRG